MKTYGVPLFLAASLALSASAGAVVVRRSLRRRQVLAVFAKLAPCLVGMEACATAHYWARELAKLGHDVRLIPPRHGSRMSTSPRVSVDPASIRRKQEPEARH